MTLQIEFVRGSRQGEIFTLGDEDLTIGRSRINGVCLTESDVSGSHLRLIAEDGQDVILENLSTRHGRTMVNGAVVDVGGRVVLHGGDTVGVGKSALFILKIVRSTEEIPTVMGVGVGSGSAMKDNGTESSTLNGKAQRNVTQQMAAGGGSSERTISHGPCPADVTMIQRTMEASDDELAQIAADIRTAQRRRVLMWVVPVILLLSTIVALYVIMRPVSEEFTSWPRGVSGASLERYVLVAPYLAIMYPDVPGSSVSTNDPGRIAINSALGQRHDIPLQIFVRKSVDSATLEVNHRDALARVLQDFSEKDTTFSPGVNRVHRFIGTMDGAGVPISYIDYTRRNGADEFFGYLVFLRHADTSFMILLEVPLAAQWRAEGFLRSSIAHFVIYARRRVLEHWEGCDWYRRDTSVDVDLDEAQKFIGQKAPVHWEAAFMRIESALVKATKSGNPTAVAQAVRLLSILRESQAVWYNQQKLSYLQAEVCGQKETMHSIQSLCESAFTPLFQDFDFRYELIKRRDWR